MSEQKYYYFLFNEKEENNVKEEKNHGNGNCGIDLKSYIIGFADEMKNNFVNNYAKIEGEHKEYHKASDVILLLAEIISFFRR